MMCLPIRSISYSRQGSDPTLEECRARHRVSLGTAEALDGLQFRELEGEVERTIRGKVDTGVVLIEFGPGSVQFRLLLKSAGPEVDGFLFDGRNLRVVANPGDRVGEIASFAGRAFDYVREGFLGGVLNTNWPWVVGDEGGGEAALIDDEKLGERKHLVCVGQKFGSGEKAILCFDPESGRHLGTKYQKVSRVSSRSTFREKWTEEFSEFEQVDGFWLPQVWSIEHGVARSTLHWRFRLTGVSHSGPQLKRRREPR